MKTFRHSQEEADDALESLHGLADGCHIYLNGDTHYIKSGYPHRDDDKPASIYTNGHQEWWVDGFRHRPNGPAVIYADGRHEWWFEHKLHRVGGPAIIEPNGEQQWWEHDKRHRIDGPALIEANGTQIWYFNDQIHKANGPATIDRRGRVGWWYHDKPFDTFEEWAEKANIIGTELYIMLKLQYG